MIRFCLLFMLLGIPVTSTVAQVNTGCIGGNCYPVAPSPVIGYPMVGPPPVLYQPRYQIQYQPYLYRGSVYQKREYRTPVRNWLFGTGHINHYYSPAVPQR